RMIYRTAILDPDLTLKQSAAVTAAAGFDAIAHSLETLISTRRNAASECFSREAWRLLSANFERVLKNPEDANARGTMLVGSHFAGFAGETASLGPPHACAAPLRATYGLAHGASLALVLPAVIEWTAADNDAALPPDIFAVPDFDLPGPLRKLAQRAE